MPQLMPFFWVNSTFMVFFIMFTLVFFYFLKNEESLKWDVSGHNEIMFNFSW